MITREMLKNRPKYSTELTPDNIYVGMRVRVKTVEQLKQDCSQGYYKNSAAYKSKYAPDSFIIDMIPLCGHEFEIDFISESLIGESMIGLKIVTPIPDDVDVSCLIPLLELYHFYPDWLETV